MYLRKTMKVLKLTLAMAAQLALAMTKPLQVFCGALKAKKAAQPLLLTISITARWVLMKWAVLVRPTSHRMAVWIFVHHGVTQATSM